MRGWKDVVLWESEEPGRDEKGKGRRTHLQCTSGGLKDIYGL